MVIMAPKDEAELRNMLYTATIYKKGPIALRYPRGESSGVPLENFKEIEIGKGEIIKEGSDIAILSVGNMVLNSVKAAEILKEKGIDAEVINMRFVKPLDAELLKYAFGKFQKLITIEDNSIIGGFGSAVSEFAEQYRYKNDIILHGLPDKFIEHGKPEELYHILKLDAEGIAGIIEQFLIEVKGKILK
jgi:1-deoxy-D-xylulose-5-phosphate synthase